MKFLYRLIFVSILFPTSIIFCLEAISRLLMSCFNLCDFPHYEDDLFTCRFLNYLTNKCE